MPNENTWLDDLLAQVAAGRMQPQDALQQFFLHKRAEENPTLTEDDHAFINAMDAAETAQTVAKWCARNAAAQGGVTAIEADLRFPGIFHARRKPPLITGMSMTGSRIMLFSAADMGSGDEYGEDCVRVSGSFTGAQADPVFLPVFKSALNTALSGHGLPQPQYITGR